MVVRGRVLAVSIFLLVICAHPEFTQAIILLTMCAKQAERFALAEVSYTIVRLMQSFNRVESRDSGPWEESLGLNCCSKNGVRVALF